MPMSRRSLSSSARICAWIVTSRAVVGSSAISSKGLQASAIAIITRCRIPPDSWCGYSPRRCLGGRDLDQLEHLERAPRAPQRASCPGAGRAASAIWSPTLNTGLRLVIGSWKIIAMSRPRSLRSARAGIRARSTTVPARVAEQDLAAGDAPGRIGDQSHDRQARHRLAGAGLADHRQRLARVERERDVLDRSDEAGLGRELRVQMADPQQRTRVRCS